MKRRRPRRTAPAISAQTASVAPIRAPERVAPFSSSGEDLTAPAALRAKAPVAKSAATALSRFCDGVLECGWLAALALVPLFFDPDLSVVFEPEKVGLLRTLALVMALAWLIKLLEEGLGGIRPGALARLPLFVPATSLLAMYVLSSTFSLAPRLSWWGSYAREQGAYTFFSYAVIFAAIAVHVRTRAQVERAINTCVLVSVPVTIYGLMQHYRLDPVPWGDDLSLRVTSTLGNPIFLGGYLIMVLPLVALRLSDAVRTFRTGRQALPLFRVVAYGVILMAQLLVLVFTQSRGPQLGLLVGLAILFALACLVSRPKLVGVSIVGLIAALGFVLALNAPSGPLQPLRTVAALSRLSHVLDAQDASTQERLLIWSGATHIMRQHPAIVYPNGEVDRLNPLRQVIGYGPEAIYQAFGPFVPPEVASMPTASHWDRTHNETLAAFVTTGLLGLLAYLVFVGAIFEFGLAALVGPRRRWLYAVFAIAGSLAGGMGLVAWKGPAYMGLGVPFGLIAGTLAYLVFLSVRAPAPIGDTWSRTVIVALLSAVAAHFAETQFGFPVSSTWLQLWASAGLIVAAGRRLSSIEAEPIEGRASNSWPERATRRRTRVATVEQTDHWPILITTVCLIALGYVFFASRSGLGILLLVVPTWLVGALVFTETRGEAKRLLLVSLGVAAAFAMYHVPMSANGQIAENEVPVSAVGKSILLGNTYTAFVACVLLALAAAGLLMVSQSSGRLPPSRLGLGMPGACFGAVLVFAFFTNVKGVVADTVLKAADPAMHAQDWDTAGELQKAAVRLRTNEDQYRMALGRSYVYSSAVAPDSDADALLTNAVDQMAAAQRLNPLDPVNTENLAKVWQQWAQAYPDDPQSAERWSRAEHYFTSALMLSPNAVGLRKDIGDFERARAAAALDRQDVHQDFQKPR
jgi:O-antigen ligase